MKTIETEKLNLTFKGESLLSEKQIETAKSLGYTVTETDGVQKIELGKVSFDVPEVGQKLTEADLSYLIRGKSIAVQADYKEEIKSKLGIVTTSKTTVKVNAVIDNAVAKFEEQLTNLGVDDETKAEMVAQFKAGLK